MNTGSLSCGVNRPEGGFNHPPPYSSVVKEVRGLYLYSPSVFSRVDFTFTVPAEKRAEA
jgi:hypothetical protein